MASLSPAEIAALTTLGGAGLGGIIKLGTWLFGERASRVAERRTDLTLLIERQEEEIKRLDALTDELRGQVDDARRQRDEAERSRAQMEGFMYRMGLSRDKGGQWRPNGEGKGGGTKP